MRQSNKTINGNREHEIRRRLEWLMEKYTRPEWKHRNPDDYVNHPDFVEYRRLLKELWGCGVKMQGDEDRKPDETERPEGRRAQPRLVTPFLIRGDFPEDRHNDFLSKQRVSPKELDGTHDEPSREDDGEDSGYHVNKI